MHIDLSRHAVIQASAGTGKTFTIVQIVLELLRGKQAKLENILLVTFAEKAAAELKDRLRQAITAALHDLMLAGSSGPDVESAAVLQEALDSFDQAPIFTIHGFCQRLLTEYAFEQGQDLRGTLAYDTDLAAAALREVQRRVWPLDFGTNLSRILARADYNSAKASNWERQVLKLAAVYREEFNHVLLPAAAAADFAADAYETRCGAVFDRLRDLVGMIPPRIETHSWYLGLKGSRIHHSTRKCLWEKYAVPVLAALGQSSPTLGPPRMLETILSALHKNGPGSFAELIADKVMERDCAGLTATMQTLHEFQQSAGGRAFANRLTTKTVGDLRRVIKELKTERGLFSFDDMIINVDQALAPANPGAPHFIGELRKRYHYAIIDEFQDTDPRQWNIFRRLFLEGAGPRLIVVGDPKQAIFGFRGADLPTYIEAARAMTTEFGAADPGLDTNWRTIDDLLKPLNRLFETSQWFPAGTPIAFRPVKPPAPRDQPIVMINDKSGAAPFTLVGLSAAATLKKAQGKFARFAVQEIKRLLAANIVFRLKGKPKQLDAGDICCLVYRRKEAAPLADALTLAGLPFTFYKQDGLWQSREASHLGIILQALAEPDDRSAFRKALLTSFFRLTPSDLAGCDEVPAAHGARVLFHKWLDYAGARQWSALSQSLVEETGILFTDLPGSRERRASNLRHLLSAMEENAYKNNLDLLDLVAFFKRRRQSATEVESDLQPMETDRPKIKIMTIHASKGLEFPIVFLAGGFTTNPRAELTYYRVEGRRVFDLGPDQKAKNAFNEEKNAENRRLLYVALTRAMLKLYVPFLPKKGNAGPVPSLLHPALAEARLPEMGAQHAALVEPTLQATFVPDAPAGTKPVVFEAPSREGPLFPALAANFNNRRRTVRSFSSLHRAARPIHFGEEKAHALDEGPSVNDNPFRGPVFGDMVHDALETIDFAEVARAATSSRLASEGSAARAVLGTIVGKHIGGLRLRRPLKEAAEECLLAVAELVWKALRTPLPGFGAELAGVPRSERLHELEFLFPEKFDMLPPPAVQRASGFFTGYMDLVARKDGLYYLVDWKTNDLDAYDAPGIDRAMTDQDYHRQYRLYLQALERWLAARHGKSFNFLEHFGGVFYLFLRGMTGAANSPGIFSRRPTESDLDPRTVLLN